MKELRIGISGWNYRPWRGTFYPKGLKQRCELEYASRKVNSIEINGSFYSLQRPESYERWYAETPPGFCFALKGGRFITHMKKLRDIETPLANFFAQGLFRLREKLGPILWQLPPNLGFDVERMESFLRLLPHDTVEASKLARRHDERLKGRADTRAKVDLPLRYAFEVRHKSFDNPAFFELMRKYKAAVVIADTGGRFPYFEDLTSEMVYVRLHGGEELYSSAYDDTQIEWWADRVRRWKRTRDVYLYFDNDAKVHAPFDAIKLMDRFRPKPQRLREGPRAKTSF